MKTENRNDCKQKKKKNDYHIMHKKMNVIQKLKFILIVYIFIINVYFCELFTKIISNFSSKISFFFFLSKKNAFRFYYSFQLQLFFKLSFEGFFLFLRVKKAIFFHNKIPSNDIVFTSILFRKFV